jgi:hypothetical protein
VRAAVPSKTALVALEQFLHRQREVLEGAPSELDRASLGLLPTSVALSNERIPRLPVKQRGAQAPEDVQGLSQILVRRGQGHGFRSVDHNYPSQPTKERSWPSVTAPVQVAWCKKLLPKHEVHAVTVFLDVDRSPGEQS